VSVVYRIDWVQLYTAFMWFSCIQQLCGSVVYSSYKCQWYTACMRFSGIYQLMGQWYTAVTEFSGVHKLRRSLVYRICVGHGYKAVLWISGIQQFMGVICILQVWG
jgi:hypothetical protein